MSISSCRCFLNSFVSMLCTSLCRNICSLTIIYYISIIDSRTFVRINLSYTM
nr:MAG TPA: hypothetical protein [Caudoviricetes sp.]